MLPLNCLPPRRLGLHYFPDTLHYREVDMQAWLPVLQELCAGWLVLRAEPSRAIPEHFIRGLKKAGIEPVIQFKLPLGRQNDVRELNPLLEVYADWGARYVLLFDRPNARESWSASGWVQQDLVERFLDRYLPAATAAQKAGLLPVFPALEPGGSYWDTAFLLSALQAMQRRKQDALLQNLVLSAYAWAGEPSRTLDWGSGGPERWPQARPYHTPEGSQDQRGFRIFDWYLAIAGSVLAQPCSIMLLQAGQPSDPCRDLCPAQEENVLNIARLLEGETVMNPLEQGNVLDSISPQVVACNFWLLSAGAESPHAGQAWYPAAAFAANAANAAEKPALVRRLALWQRERVVTEAAGGVPVSGATHPIRHYLLLPGAEWGVSDWYLEVIRPFVKKHKPTVGFSVEEAGKAARVTVVGGMQHYPEDLLERLQKAGSRVEQITGDGTNIASQLAER